VERRRLEAEEERINHQREQLVALKSEIEAKIESLSKIQQQIAADLDKKEAVLSEKEQKRKAAEEAKIRMLSKVYASMKPKQAAAIIDKIDIEVIEKVFLQMKGEQVGNILSYVEKDRAAKISERLAESNAAVPAQ
jgi:flagellar motility protein MotE (MotC chaperone)